MIIMEELFYAYLNKYLLTCKNSPKQQTRLNNQLDA